MNVKEYIASGILELYVAGQLSEKENLEVHDNAMQYPEIATEIKAIENAILSLTKTAALREAPNFVGVKTKITQDGETKVAALDTKASRWPSYLGWAASIALAIGLFWMYNQNKELKSQIEIAAKENISLEQQIADSNASLEKSQTLLETIRDKEIAVVPLGGQAASPEAYAKAYWNKKGQKVFIDAKGLPEPPDGMVYQVWSLKLSPLTPTSIGLLEDFVNDENKIFTLSNENESEAFGITLEPAGGSAGPNLEQLYTLGAVSSP